MGGAAYVRMCVRACMIHLSRSPYVVVVLFAERNSRKTLRPPYDHHLSLMQYANMFQAERCFLLGLLVIRSKISKEMKAMVGEPVMSAPV